MESQIFLCETEDGFCDIIFQLLNFCFLGIEAIMNYLKIVDLTLDCETGNKQQILILI